MQLETNNISLMICCDEIQKAVAEKEIRLYPVWNQNNGTYFLTAIAAQFNHKRNMEEPIKECPYCGELLKLKVMDLSPENF